MSGITVTIDDREVIDFLARMSGRAADMTRPMREIGGLVRSAALESFVAQSAPDGQKWPVLSPATLIARARRVTGGKHRKKSGGLNARASRIVASGKALLDTGVLRGSIAVHDVTATTVTVGTNLIYAAIHQFGGKAGRGRKVSIPARPFLPGNPLPEALRGDILAAIRRHLLAA